MEIKLDGLNKAEYSEIMKHLPINELREVVIADNKLAKKYVSGFRTTNTPLPTLVGLYYQEIVKKNVIVEDKLVSVIEKYLEQFDIYNLLSEISACKEIADYVKFSLYFIESNCSIPFYLICKLVGSNLEESVVSSIQKINELYMEKIVAVQLLNSEHEKNEKELNKELDKAKKERDAVVEKKERAEENAREEKKHFEDSIEELMQQLDSEKEASEKTKRELEELNLINKDLALKEKSLRDTNEELEKRIYLHNDEINSLKSIIEEYENKNKDLEQILAKIQEKKKLEYDETIIKLTQEIISDLENEYSLSLPQITEILNGIEEPHSIINVWESISSKNALLLHSVSEAIENDIADMTTIDWCDDAENNLLVKYIILKSIKSLLFEYMSVKEKQTSIASIFAKKSL